MSLDQILMLPPGYGFDGGGLAEPSINSASSASLAEGASGTAHTFTQDAAGTGTVVWSIEGGADAAFFTINSGTGVLSLTAAKSHTFMADADFNNDYAVTVRCTNEDASAFDEQTFTLNITPVRTAYVSPSGNNATAVVNNPALPWAEMATALQYLGDTYPASTTTVRVLTGMTWQSISGGTAPMQNGLTICGSSAGGHGRPGTPITVALAPSLIAPTNIKLTIVDVSFDGNALKVQRDNPSAATFDWIYHGGGAITIAELDLSGIVTGGTGSTGATGSDSNGNPGSPGVDGQPGGVGGSGDPGGTGGAGGTGGTGNVGITGWAGLISLAPLAFGDADLTISLLTATGGAGDTGGEGGPGGTALGGPGGQGGNATDDGMSTPYAGGDGGSGGNGGTGGNGGDGGTGGAGGDGGTITYDNATVGVTAYNVDGGNGGSGGAGNASSSSASGGPGGSGGNGIWGGASGNQGSAGSSGSAGSAGASGSSGASGSAGSVTGV